mmetsp:Transcript_18812/g.28333  ORF Transcript_18812/g.28333 Transcript_18812/m.28333 type:complete len:218 (-) Transcript_18812:361-1014(-)
MSMIGALIYAVPSCRADVAQAVGVLARALTFPTQAMFLAAQRVLTYLAQTKSRGITYDGDVQGGGVLEAYSDSDWSVQHSTTGWVVLFGGAVVAWRSRKQHSISMSSTEAEIIAASDCALELVYLRGLLAEMGFPQDKPTILHVDNAGAVELSRDLKSCQRSRHVERRYLKVRELAAAKVVDVQFVPTADNIADAFTKVMTDSKAFLRHIQRCMNFS